MRWIIVILLSAHFQKTKVNLTSTLSVYCLMKASGPNVSNNLHISSRFVFCLNFWGYSRPHIQQENKTNTTEVPSSSKHSSQLLNCYCRQPESREKTLIACDNPGCHIEWYHTNCLKLKSIPKDKWYCPTCRVLPEFIRKWGTKRPRKT